MRFLIAVQGSFGDINPCAGLGVGLRERGHEVLFLTSEYYKPWLNGFGIETVSTLSREEHTRVTAHRDFAHPRKSFRLLWKLILSSAEREYNAIRERYQPGETVILTRLWNIGARVAAEKFKAPVTSLAVSPNGFLSFFHPASSGRTPVPGGKWLRSLVLRRINSRVLPPINDFRQKAGLPPIDRPFSERIASPHRILGLFPEWFEPAQPDWPPMLHTGFPLFEGAPNNGVPPEVEEFLAKGEPPIVFTTSSALQSADGFFRSSIEAVQKMGARAILLTSSRENLPSPLPPRIASFGYVPLGPLLQRACAIVHHGGVGTVAAALSAGIPQLVAPMNFDNPHNAKRVAQMGVGAFFNRRKYQPKRIANELQTLLTSDSVKERCAYYAAKIRAEDGIERACTAIEALSREPSSSQVR